MNITAIVLLVSGTAAALLWFAMFLKGKGGCAEIIAHIDKKENGLGELYFVGFNLLKLVRYDMCRPSELRRKNEIAEVRGSDYAAFYLWVLRMGEATIALTGVSLSLLAGALAKNAVVSVLFILVTFIFAYVKEDEYNEKIKKRRQDILMSLPTVVSKVTLLVNSGMPMNDAWRRIAYSGEGPLYTEMQLVCYETDNGYSEHDAYTNFTNRCNVKEVRKFVSAVLQNQINGSNDSITYLKAMSDEMWTEKKNNVKKLGDAANSKLMIPMFMIFVGIMVMIMVPMMANMSF
jgi:tight adherence protein C